MALIPYPGRMRVALMPLALLGGLVRRIGQSAAGTRCCRAGCGR